MASRRSSKAAPAGPAGPPGAAPVNFLHGDFAAATVGGVTLNIFDWRVEYRTRTVNTRAFGERWERNTAVESGWTFRGRGYVTSASAAHALAAGFNNDASDPPVLTVVGYSGATTGTAIFTGTGTMTQGNLSAPDGAMAEQDFEIMCEGPPTVGI